MSNVGYPGVVVFLANEVEHRKQLAQASNRLLQGKLNVVIQVTLNAGATTTTVTDTRIGANTGLFFSPLTANAAAAQAGLWVSSQKNGSATLTHANTATVDRTFNVLLIG
ncbi:hypothetical protein F0160_22700 [Paraburkholderia sp. JPY303]|uniref:hypothetical protein n=1 Tax=Paraburkholderia atlantica TaxID=2654982 RepID=UPI00159018E0|nr:hypothetical protein [Paraburkholderia atlantica]NUY33298.1 hypothetical protein [Paraburkholderia atlantica]